MKITPEQKPPIMAEIGKDWAFIQDAKKQVHDLEVLMAAKIKPVAETWPGDLHKMPVPVKDPTTGAVTIVDMITSFRKSGDTYAVSALDPAGVK